MKQFILVAVLLLYGVSLCAQTSDIESTIKALEQQEVQAVLVKDTVSLKKIWSPDFTVNAPLNRVVEPGKNTLDRPVITTLNYLRFERNIEKILVKGDVVITMGNELVVIKGKDGESGRTIRRRYSNIWMRQNNEWMLIARHANEICQ
jgi:ketosteroid isomerase-like protein